MAKVSMLVAALLAPLVSADLFGRQVVATCNRDNCLRAVIASSATPGPSSALKDCSSFFKKTFTPNPTTTTVTVTTTPTVSVTATSSTTTVTTTTVVTITTSITSTTSTATTITTSVSTYTPPAKRDLEKRATVTSPTNVPAYASACSGTARYSSACSCVSVSESTVTLDPSTVTTTKTVAAATAATATVSISTVIVTQTSTTTSVSVQVITSSTATTTTATQTLTTTATCNIPTQDPRCQLQSGLCCNNSGDSCYPCTNPGAVCIKVCDINNDCIYGGVSDQGYSPIIGYYSGNLCVGYSGCTGCPSKRGLFRRADLEMSPKIDVFADRIVRHADGTKLNP